MQPCKTIATRWATLGAAVSLATLAWAQPAAACGMGSVVDGHGRYLPLSAAQSRAATHTPAWLSTGTSGVRSFYDPSWVPIVGMWKFSFISKGSKGIPDGTILDAGYTTWHNDGTELMNSSRPPMSEAFCMGVWRALGRTTFRLNHIAMSWTPDGQTYIGPTNIREQVTTDRWGNSYSGTFTLDQYATDETTLLAHVQGRITATRINVF